MKLGLYSVTYAGMWDDGPALSIRQFVHRAKRFGFDAVELDARVPHALPYLMTARDRKETRDAIAKAGLELAALAANNDFSSPVIEYRDANIQMVVDLIALCKDLGAPVLRVFTAWRGSKSAQRARDLRGGPPQLRRGLPPDPRDGPLAGTASKRSRL